MPLQLTGRHMTIRDELKEYIDKKVNRLRRMCPKIDEMSFTLTKNKLEVLAEGKFRAGKIVAQASVRASQAHEAVDLLVDKLEAQVTKTKKKMNDRDQGTIREAARAEEPLELTEEDLDDEEPYEAASGG